MTAFATLADLATYLAVDVSALDSDSQRLLNRAQELIEAVTLGRIDSANTTHTTAIKNATCAQVEYWQYGPGEDMDISGPVQGKTIGKMQIQYGAGSNRVSPTALAPRAYRFLLMAGLYYAGAQIK